MPVSAPILTANQIVLNEDYHQLIVIGVAHIFIRSKK